MSFFHRSLFVFAHSLGQTDFYPVFQRFIKKNQWRHLLELRAELDKQLKYMTQYGKDNVPSNRTLFKNLGIRSETIKTVDNFQKLHVLIKEMIKEYWDDPHNKVIARYL